MDIKIYYGLKWTTPTYRSGSSSLDSYDRLIQFGQKHLNDLFVLDGIQNVNARDRILREIVSNTLAHRDYSSGFPAKMIIDEEKILIENSNLAHSIGELNLFKFEPFSKNPPISKVFREIGLADELGSGMRNTYKFTELYSNEKPIFEEGSIFRTIVPIRKIATKKVGIKVDFEEIEECQKKGDWDRSAEILGKVALSLEKAGADFIVICTNTMHKVVSGIKKYTKLPILHIAEMTAIELKKAGIKKIGLLGTKYTMQQDFYKQILIDNGIEVVIPNSKDIEIVNSIIFNELCLGKIKKESKDKYLRIIKDLSKAGAKGVILGCTEIGLLIKQEDTDVPLFDTTNIHATSAALYAIEEK